jgi:hypothetical protein
MGIARLTRRPDPRGRETLPSYLDRLAAEHDVPLMLMLKHIGLLEPAQKRPSLYGVSLRPGHLRDFIRATDLDEYLVRRMLVTALPGAENVDLSGNVWATVLTTKLWLNPGSSHACPLCLADGGAWQLDWKSNLCFACLRHQTLLIGRCPRCRRRLGHGGDKRATYPPLLDVEPQPGHCRALDREAKRTGCGFDLRTIEPETLADHSRLLDAQREIDELLRGKPAVIAGHHMPADQALREVRTACAVVLHTGQADELPSLPKGAMTAFEQHVTERTSGDRRHTYLKGPHNNPLLIAATLPSALHLLAAQDETELQVRVGVFAERLPRHARTTAPGGLAARFGLTPLLERAVSSHLARVRPVHVFERARRQGGYARRCWSFTTSHIPQLLRPARFEGELADLFPTKRPAAARRFCSVALVRFAFSLGWAESAQALGLERRSTASSANHFLCELTENAKVDCLMDALWKEAWHLEREWRPVNYADRRQALATLRTVPSRLCPQARLPPRVPWDRLCAAWLWAELTSGDPFDAPAFRRAPARRDREAFLRFTATALTPEHQSRLRGYGLSLL